MGWGAGVTLDDWYFADGVPVWAAQQLRQPHLELHESDGPLRVVLREDYESLRRLLDEAVLLLGAAQHQQIGGNEGLSLAIQRFLASAG